MAAFDIASIWIIPLGFLCFFPTLTDERQLCLSCGYQYPMEDMSCAETPLQYKTSASVRAKCPFECYFKANFDAETNEATYAFRGCYNGKANYESSCLHVQNVISCEYYCANDNYCNNLTVSALLSKLSSTSHVHCLQKPLLPVTLFVSWSLAKHTWAGLG